MKLRSLLMFALAGAVFLGRVSAADTATAPVAAPAPADSPEQDLQALVGKVRTKISAGETTEAALAKELAEFDALLAKYKGQKTDAVAEIAVMKAMLYLQVIENEAKARELLTAIKTDFAGTTPAKEIDGALEQIDAMAKMKAAKAALIGKTAPELHFKWSNAGDLKTLSALKGKVVVLDFWATWCGPCIASFPKVREEVAHFKNAPVVFIGVTSLQGFVANLGGGKIDTKDNPTKEMELMKDFMKAKEMTWNVAFSDEEVFNPDYGVEGIPFIAIIAPDGTVRHAGLNPHDPSADIEGKVTAILKEFKLDAPKS